MEKRAVLREKRSLTSDATRSVPTLQLSEEDKRENHFSLAHNFRLLSAYRTTAGVKLWVITERSRSATTILLPSDY